jgi:OmpA-OmpF porin, OOP family
VRANILTASTRKNTPAPEEESMTCRRLVAVVVTLLALAALAPRLGAQDMKDHPLIPRFPGSTLAPMFNPATATKEFDEYALPTGPYRNKKFTKTERLEGRVTRVEYLNPPNRSTLEVYRSYQQALAKAGFQTLFACTAAECGDSGINDRAPEVGYWCIGIEIQCPTPMRYIAAKLSRPTGDVYAAIKVLNDNTYLGVVEVKAMEPNLVKVKSDVEMKSDITTVGHSPVYGVYFDTGKAEVKPNSDPTLSEIAKLMKANPSMKLHVVGHTDNVGTLPANMTLSKQRADAVVAALVTKYQIVAARLDAAGVGSLAPVATNRTEDGRAKNRRVELVEQ